MVGRKGVALVATAVCAATAGTVLAYAAAEDSADMFLTPVRAVNSGKVTFSNPAFETVCTVSANGGPLSGATLTFNITPPTFSDASGQPCGGTDTISTNSNSGAWTLREADAANDEGVAEPNATGDHLVMTIPKAGLVDYNSSGAGCVITVAPDKAFAVSGSYNDAGVFTISSTVPAAPSDSCFVSFSSIRFIAKYILTPRIYDKG